LRLHSELLAAGRPGEFIAAIRHYRSCDEEEDNFWNQKPFIVRPWAVHWSIMWRFIGLLAATVLSMTLVLLFAFSKFAHAIYRLLALLIYYHRAV